MQKWIHFITSMATINYYLKGAISEQRIRELQHTDKSFLKEQLYAPRQIYLKLSISGERLQIYTKKRIAQYYWNKNKQEIDCKRYKNEGVQLNEWLSDLKTDIYKLAQENELNGIRPNISELKKILETKTLSKPTAPNFKQYFNKFLSQQKNSEGHSLKPNTIKKYNGFENHLTAFSNHYKFNLEISRLDKDFLSSFKDFLSQNQKLSDNTVAKYVKAAKTFIKFYINQGLIQSYDVSQVKSTEKEGEVYVLPIKQILQLQQFDFKSSALNNVRDIFCFMCWTGQRFSDIMSIKHDDLTKNINDETVWNLITKKTGDSISVPIITYANEILANHKEGGSPLPNISNQKMNEHLKSIGKKIEFDNKVRVVKYFDGRKQETHVPFYEVLTTHVARKSYITNSLILGIPERVVREVSGHRDEKSFRRYVSLAENYKTSIIKTAYSLENISQFL
jgi:site-specific recombinase XerD